MHNVLYNILYYNQSNTHHNVCIEFDTSFKCQSCVARQSLSNFIQQSNLKEMLIQTWSYRRAKVELNWSIEVDTTIAQRLDWALVTQIPWSRGFLAHEHACSWATEPLSSRVANQTNQVQEFFACSGEQQCQILNCYKGSMRHCWVMLRGTRDLIVEWLITRVIFGYHTTLCVSAVNYRSVIRWLAWQLKCICDVVTMISHPWKGGLQPRLDLSVFLLNNAGKVISWVRERLRFRVNVF